MRLSIIRDTWVPATYWDHDEVEPKGYVRCPGCRCVNSEESDIVISDLYDPNFKLTLDYGVVTGFIPGDGHVRRRESGPYLTYTTIRVIEDKETSHDEHHTA